MGFEIIKAETRTASMIEWFSGICSTITDFLPGSKIRSKFETIAVEMEAQDYAFYQAIKKAIPISIYQAFDFKLKAAQKASGMVTFTGGSATSSMTIPAGTVLGTANASDNKIYATTEDATIPAGQTQVQAPVLCTSPGSFCNTPINTITRFITSISGITSVTNAAAVVNGMDRETEDSRRQRFNKYITTLTRGTKEAIEYGATTASMHDISGATIESVQFVNVVQPAEDDPEQPAGEIYCYIYNGSGGTSDELVAEAQKIIDGYADSAGTKIPGYKAAGVICTVAKATEQAINVTCTVTPISTEADKVQMSADCQAGISRLIQELNMGEDIILSQIISRAMEASGVYRVSVATPTADISIASNTIPIVGTITVNVP